MKDRSNPNILRQAKVFCVMFGQIYVAREQTLFLYVSSFVLSILLPGGIIWGSDRLFFNGEKFMVSTH